MLDTLNLYIPTHLTKIESNFLQKKQVEIFIKRDDMIHKVISGNKWRKLKYNFKEAKLKGHNTILSYGGAYSNHLHALSYACDKMGFNSIGVVRGNQEQAQNNTLSFCKKHNMQLHYLDRTNYRLHKYSIKTLDFLQKKYSSFYMIPEGGNNFLGVKGCEEILSENDFAYDYVCAPVGTGCTASGLIKSMQCHQRFIGFVPFKKSVEQKNNIIKFCASKPNQKWSLIPDINFGGFGKIDNNLIKFVQQFKIDYDIELDLIYMGKLFYSLFNLIKKNFFLNRTKILVLHTGGLQGLRGFNFKYL